nr:DUF3265 domain-containing protein [Vibrio sp. V24_P1S3T111]
MLVYRNSIEICLTNASRGTANAWHFYYALAFVIIALCGKLAVALSTP